MKYIQTRNSDGQVSYIIYSAGNDIHYDSYAGGV